jgi:hypothetical protein
VDHQGGGAVVPEVIKRDCHTCAKPLSPEMAALGMFNHPGCDPVPQDMDLVEPPPTDPGFTPVNPKIGAVPCPDIAKAVKDEFTTMLLWSEEYTPRSQQVNIGPSELGVDCERRLAYRVMGLGREGPNLSRTDPWPGFVGSAIHTRVEEAVVRYMNAHPLAPKWAIEQRVQVDPNINGRADFYRGELLVDLKSAGKDVMDKVKKSGPPMKYRIQQMSYAKGLRAVGQPIQYICLAFVPRSGWLRDMYVWAEPYDDAMALAAVARPYQIAQRLGQMDIRNNPHLWNDVPAEPSYECNYCPMYDRYLPDGLGATDKGCPGYQPGRK